MVGLWDAKGLQQSLLDEVARDVLQLWQRLGIFFIGHIGEEECGRAGGQGCANDLTTGCATA